MPDRRVLIATPAHDGRVDVWYVASMINSVRVAQGAGVFLHPIFMSYDALVQRARNDLFRLAVEGGYDDLIFIDSDMEWSPDWIMSLLAREEDVVGGTARKKTDDAEIYVCKTDDLTVHENGLIRCQALGTGFVRLSRKAFVSLWDASTPYQNEGRECRMICEVAVVDGQLYSEDIMIFEKLRKLGFAVWLDPTMTCAHIGVKKWTGDFRRLLSGK